MRTSMLRRLGAEFLGTLFLLATVVGSGIMGEKLSGGNIAIALLANSVATAAFLVVFITMLAPLSGAHFNPAVSMVMRLRGEMSTSQMLAYWGCQILGGLLGVIVAHAMFELPLVQVSGMVRTGVAQWIAEAVATFGLIMTILGVGRSAPEKVAMSVGLYILAAYWFTASTSFANPAVTIARATTNTFAGIAPSGVAAFILAQIAGALAASWIAGKLLEPVSSRD